MNCREFQDRALDRPVGDAEIQSHLESCEACRAEQRDLERTILTLKARRRDVAPDMSAFWRRVDSRPRLLRWSIVAAGFALFAAGFALGGASKRDETELVRRLGVLERRLEERDREMNDGWIQLIRSLRLEPVEEPSWPLVNR